MNNAPSLLRFAEDGDDAAISELLLRDPGTANIVWDEFGWTPLHRAATFGFESTVALLLKAGASVDTVDKRRQTALHFAAGSYSVPTLMRLLQSGANINARNSQWETPIQIAVTYSNVSGFLFLLGQGARVDFKDRSGRDALAHAEWARSETPKGRKYYHQRRDFDEIIWVLETMQSMNIVHTNRSWRPTPRARLPQSTSTRLMGS